MKKNVVFGFLGVKKDSVSQRRGKFTKRFERWRPTVSIVQHPETLLVHKVILLTEEKDRFLKDIIVEDIQTLSPNVAVEIRDIAFTDPWDVKLVFQTLYGFFLDFDFDLEKEDYFFHFSTGTNIQQASVFLSAGAKYFPGKLLQSAPDNESETRSKLKIIDLDDAPKAVASIFKRRREQATHLLKGGIQTKNRAFNEMINKIERVAIRAKSPMLITGPTGAGKSALASRIYDLKNQRYGLSGEFVEINCATIVGESSAMSALFGHSKGAYTGAAAKRDGLLKKADKGVLFLDEIGELGQEEQAMLLRALETKKFFPLGSDTEVSSDFQLICGTNRDLRVEVREKRFREDLFARINLFTYRLPGLKERREDIQPNLDYELERYQEEYGNRVRVMPAALKRYLSFAHSEQAIWVGNFRDLNASVLRMSTLADNGIIDDVVVKEEIETLMYLWGEEQGSDRSMIESLLGDYFSPKQLANIDRIAAIELDAVLKASKQFNSAASVERYLYNVSRQGKTRANDGARIITLLKKYGLRFEDVSV